MENQKDTDFGPIVKIISHDLRGPLGNFKNVMALIKTGELSMEQLKMFMEQIELGMDRSLNLLDELIEWSIAGAMDKKVTQEELDISAVIQEVYQTLKLQYEAKNIALEINEKKLERCFADRSALKLVLKNLLSNSLAFTRSEGKVIVEMNEDVRQIIVSVSDNGIGIPETMQTNIFRIGKDNRRLGTNGEKGTGIGLFICKDLIEKNSGRIWLDHSEEGIGTTFTFIIKKLPQK